MAIKIQHCALRSLLNCFSNTYWWGSFSRTHFILMNCGCKRAKSSNSGKDRCAGRLGCQQTGDFVSRKIRFGWLLFVFSGERKKKSPPSFSLQLQLNGRRWCYEIVSHQTKFNHLWSYADHWHFNWQNFLCLFFLN